MNKKQVATVGDLRSQSALAESQRPVIVVTDDDDLKELISSLEVVEVYPDTTDGQRNWNSTFKIKVRRKQEE